MEYTIWVTNGCNLRCNYCYVPKNSASMSIDMAQNIVSYINQECRMSDKLVVSFHGGEPLTNINIIKFIVMELKKRKNIQFLMTTNGTLIDDDIALFLSEYMKYGVSISIDGIESAHDRNRKDMHGLGTYNTVLHSIQKLNQLGCCLRLRMTITPENIPSLFESYCRLFEISRLNQVVYIPVIESTMWTKEKIEEWQEQEKKIFEYMRKNHSDIFKNYIESLKYYYLRQRPACTIKNRTSYHIDSQGYLYPCIRAVGKKEFIIGNVWEGFDDNMVDQLQDDLSDEAVVTNKACLLCGKRVICEVNRCKIMSKVMNGSYNMPSAVWCNLNHIKYNLIQEYDEIS